MKKSFVCETISSKLNNSTLTMSDFKIPSMKKMHIHFSLGLPIIMQNALKMLKISMQFRLLTKCYACVIYDVHDVDVLYRRSYCLKISIYLVLTLIIQTKHECMFYIMS